MEEWRIKKANDLILRCMEDVRGLDVRYKNDSEGLVDVLNSVLENTVNEVVGVFDDSDKDEVMIKIITLVERLDIPALNVEGRSIESQVEAELNKGCYRYVDLVYKPKDRLRVQMAVLVVEVLNGGE